jgi:hypothetical protein
MGQHPKVIDAMCTAARAMAAGAGGTRNILGTNRALVDLEAKLADLHDKDAALVFRTGYVYNHTGIATIARLLPNCLFLFDALNHNSMIEGVRAAAAVPSRSGATTISSTWKSSLACNRRPPEADRLRERLFDGRRHRPARGDMRTCGTLWRNDLPR